MGADARRCAAEARRQAGPGAQGPRDPGVGHARTGDDGQRGAVLRHRFEHHGGGHDSAIELSPKGDARIRDASFSVPSTCLAPVILVEPNGSTTIYIALDGWRP